jgi:hypothetical protein
MPARIASRISGVFIVGAPFLPGHAALFMLAELDELISCFFAGASLSVPLIVRCLQSLTWIAFPCYIL